MDQHGPDYPEDQYDASDEHGGSEGGILDSLVGWVTDGFGPSNDPTWGPSSPPSNDDGSNW